MILKLGLNEYKESNNQDHGERGIPDRETTRTSQQEWPVEVEYAASLLNFVRLNYAQLFLQ